MSILKKISVICIIILSSCSLNEENFEVNQDQDFYEKVAIILDSPTSYSSLTPEKINPFDFDLSKKLQEWEKSGARVQDNSSESAEIPEEIANASIDFQNLSNRLIQKSKVLAVEDFRKLAYAVELEVINSKLSEIKKDFLLRELAALKAIMSILEKKSENARIMCDSDFECKVLACVQQRVEDALSEDKTWLERLINTIEMPETIPYWWVYCILEYFEEG